MALALALSSCATTAPAPSSPADVAAVTAGRDFLDRYVDPDGRVVRRDQGGDTVSEGQAYAMVVAVALGDADTFARAWSWTKDHLRRPDGLLAYLWREGRVADDTPAADADTQAAWALALADRRFPGQGYAAAGVALARAVVEREVEHRARANPVLVAGPWAVGSRHRPATVEPGYWALPALTVLGTLTQDPRWQDMADSARELTGDLSGPEALLPPDWAQLDQGQPVHAVTSPSGGTPVGCGPDGQRAIIWFAVDATGRQQAADWWPRLRADAARAPLSRSVTGDSASEYQSPLSAAASAAAARAAGDIDESDRLLGVADTLAQRYPTYYGSAWRALARFLLTTDRLR